MEEQKKIERDLMSQEEFEEYVSNGAKVLNLATYEGVRIFKSIKRAIRRGHVTTSGVIAPKRPFHNRANTSKRAGVHSRGVNELKKRIYGELKQHYGRAL